MTTFCVGDRVRVYGHKSTDWLPFTGLVVEWAHPSDGNERSGMTMAVRGKRGDTLFCHPKQCRKLKPKPKPEPKAPRRVWINHLDIPKPDSWKVAHASISGDAQEDSVCFTETPRGAAVITRAMLLLAFEGAYGNALANGKSPQWAIEQTATALGLPNTKETK